MSSHQDQLADMGMDLAHHASLLLKGLMTAGAYALYKKIYGGNLNGEAARKVRQQLPSIARESADGQVHGSALEVVVEEEQQEDN
jgi:hypothetical protein